MKTGRKKGGNKDGWMMYERKKKNKRKKERDGWMDAWMKKK